MMNAKNAFIPPPYYIIVIEEGSSTELSYICWRKQQQDLHEVYKTIWCEKKHLHITGNWNSLVEKYQTQISNFLPACCRWQREGLAVKRRFFNASWTCLVDKWLQTHPERTGKSSYSCGRLALVPREPIYVKYLSLWNLVKLLRWE